VPDRVQADPVAPGTADLRLGRREQFLRHPTTLPVRADRHAPEVGFSRAGDVARDRTDDFAAGGRRD
jgi:hypothetical protein